VYKNVFKAALNFIMLSLTFLMSEGNLLKIVIHQDAALPLLPYSPPDSSQAILFTQMSVVIAFAIKSVWEMNWFV
jgi:hypothetical protein